MFLIVCSRRNLTVENEAQVCFGIDSGIAFQQFAGESKSRVCDRRGSRSYKLPFKSTKSSNIKNRQILLLLKQCSRCINFSILEFQRPPSNPEYLVTTCHEAFRQKRKWDSDEFVLTIDDAPVMPTQRLAEFATIYAQFVGSIYAEPEKRHDMSTRARQKIITIIIFCLYLLAIFLTPLLSSTNSHQCKPTESHLGNKIYTNCYQSWQSEFCSAGWQTVIRQGWQ